MNLLSIVIFIMICFSGYAQSPHFIKRIRHIRKEEKLESQKIDEYTHAIFNILEKYRLDYDIDRLISGERQVPKTITYSGKPDLLKKIRHFVEEKRKISLFLPAFPFKAPSRLRTISDKPDMAERVGLETLYHLLQDIEKVYPIGGEIAILSSGQLLADIFDLSDETLKTYEILLKKLASDLKGLKIMSFSEYLGTSSAKEAREKAEEMVPTCLEKTKEIIYKDFTAFRFLCSLIEARIPCPSYQRVKMMGLKLLERQLKLRKIINLINDPDIIRLSVHMHDDISKYFGIKLCENSSCTPWLGVLVVEADGSKRIIAYKDINKKEYKRLVETVNGVPCPFYKSKHLIKGAGSLSSTGQKG